MNTSTLRRKRVLLPAIAVVAVLGVGGTAWTATADGSVDGSERDRVAAAATDAVGGTAIEVEASDDRGEAYEVEVRLADGTEVDVALAEDLSVVAEERDDDTDDADEAGDDTPDRPLTDAEQDAAGEAAVEAVGGGEVLRVEASDDASQAYEVEVRDADGAVWDVDLDAEYGVVDQTLDD
ncbi:PepSY domain-containing protein [Nocardioides sp. SYSU DS0663]|uniref:PepSY domain-containing protein n=1 Tax=Nocardioides sp. SYSU DS0663 TaxID=3416445 RepID=UPI003F4BA026